MKVKAARFISLICHPLITLPVFTIVVLFLKERAKDALLHSSMIIFGFFLPLTLHMYRKFKNGSYSNFDVSNRNQRQLWYQFASLLLLVVTTIMFATEQPKSLQLSILSFLILLLISGIINYRIKTSLHVTLTIYLAFLIIPMSFHIGVILISLTIVVGWARIILRRHTLKEVLTGFIIGTLVGVSSFVCDYLYKS
jgi:membrane-associated phospholipid phosphatase